jgi:thiamine-phosphate pyrophosphorylase
VTDRRAFKAAPGTDALLAAIRSAANNDVDWIQIREKDLEARALAGLVRLALESTRRTRTKILVNDRLDVAIAAGAAGVHLGEMSLPVERVADWRRSARHMDFQIGVSCHSTEAAKAAERGGADYIFFGPVFSTPSKISFGPPQGIDRLLEVCSAVQIPVLAIGGVNLENASSCMEAGAAGIAAITLFQEVPDAVVRLREK